MHPIREAILKKGRTLLERKGLSGAIVHTGQTVLSIARDPQNASAPSAATVPTVATVLTAATGRNALMDQTVNMVFQRKRVMGNLLMARTSHIRKAASHALLPKLAAQITRAVSRP